MSTYLHVPRAPGDTVCEHTVGEDVSLFSSAARPEVWGGRGSSETPSSMEWWCDLSAATGHPSAPATLADTHEHLQSCNALMPTTCMARV